MSSWRLDWPFGTAEVQALGGMLGPITFRLPDGRALQPMYVAPWVDEEIDPDLPGLMKGLRGEWPCVPFGRTDVPAGLQSQPTHEETKWSTQDADDDWPHGYAANRNWSCLSHDPHHVTLAIDYPATSPIARLERQISADPEQPALDLSLTIWARADATVPVALHPTFRIGDGLRLKPGPFTEAIAYPVPAEAGISLLAPDGRSADLGLMPALAGTLDLTRLPLLGQTEELLQLKDCKPPFSLYYETVGVTMSLWWDQNQLPDAMLWISNGGRAYHPWNGRNYALGIEPVNGAFDLGRIATPPAGHPLQGRGLALKAGRPTRIDYRLAAT